MEMVEERITFAGFCNVGVITYTLPIGATYPNKPEHDLTIDATAHWLDGYEGNSMWLSTRFGTPEWGE